MLSATINGIKETHQRREAPQITTTAQAVRLHMYLCTTQATRVTQRRQMQIISRQAAEKPLHTCLSMIQSFIRAWNCLTQLGIAERTPIIITLAAIQIQSALKCAQAVTT